MAKTVFVSLGFDITAFILSLNALGLQAGDKVVFVTPKTETERSRQAKKGLEALLANLAARGLNLSYEFLAVDEEDVLAATASVIAKALQSDEVYVEAVGGVRSIVVALTLAAVALGDRVKALHTLAESTGKRVRAPLLTPQSLQLDETDVRILRIADQKDRIELSQVARRLNLSPPTASRRLRALERKFLLQRVSSKPVAYTLTPLGRVVKDVYGSKRLAA